MYFVRIEKGDVTNLKISLGVAVSLIGDICVWVFEQGRALSTEKIVWMKYKKRRELIVHLNSVTVCEPGLHSFKSVPV